MQTGIVKSREIASKIANRILNPTNKARLNRFFILDILFKMPPDLPVKKCLRVIQYICQIGSAEVFQTLKEVLMGNCTCLPKLPLNDNPMVFFNFDFIQKKKSKDHIKFAKEKWETYYLYRTFANSMAVEQQKKKTKRKTQRHKIHEISLNKPFVNSSH